MKWNEVDYVKYKKLKVRNSYFAAKKKKDLLNFVCQHKPGTARIKFINKKNGLRDRDAVLIIRNKENRTKKGKTTSENTDFKAAVTCDD